MLYTEIIQTEAEPFTWIYRGCGITNQQVLMDVFLLNSDSHTYDNCYPFPIHKHRHDPVPLPMLTSHDCSYWKSHRLQSAYAEIQVTVTVWPLITVVADLPVVLAASISTPVALLDSAVEPMIVAPAQFVS